MRDDDCNRREALREELSNDWDKLNLAAKSLILIGILLFICVIFITIYSNGDEVLTRNIEVIFRSSIASIFGFLLSSNIKTYNKNKLLQRQDCEDEIIAHNYKDGNLVQIIIALVTCIVSVVVILIIYITNNTENIAAISQLRDFMCTSIGFLLGESKIKK